MPINARPEYNPDNVMMMDYLRGEIPVEESTAIETDIKHGSALMKLAKQVPMSGPIKEFTHMSGIGAYWVNETERIRTSSPQFIHVEMRAYKLAVIVPVSSETLNYSVTNFFELMRPEIAEAFAKKIDQAALLNVNNPFRQSIYTAAQNAGQVITESGNKYTDLSEAIGSIYAQDLEPRGIAATRTQWQKYAGTLDSSGRPIFNEATAGAPSSILGQPIAWMPKNTFEGSDVVEIVGDWDEAYYGIPRGIEYKISDEASLTTLAITDPAHTDPTSPTTNTFNLYERDAWALRAIMEIGFMVVKDEAFAVVEAASGGSGGGQGDAPEA